MAWRLQWRPPARLSGSQPLPHPAPLAAPAQEPGLRKPLPVRRGARCGWRRERAPATAAVEAAEPAHRAVEDEPGADRRDRAKVGVLRARERLPAATAVDRAPEHATTAADRP